MCRTVCALNTEKRMSVELKFEIFDFCISILIYFSQQIT